jgi:acetyl-CoA synthetase
METMLGGSIDQPSCKEKLFILHHMPPAWQPNSKEKETANISQFMNELGMTDRQTFHRWTVTHFTDFWQKVIRQLNIIFQVPYTKICDWETNLESPQWLVNSKFNIIDSCFNARPEDSAIIYEENQSIISITYQQLKNLVNQIALSLKKSGFKKHDPIAICMPMNQYAVALYLAIIKIGCIVVSIADSFSSQEIALRLSIAKAKAIFTQDTITWGEKHFPLYEKISLAAPKKIIVLPANKKISILLREGDISWEDFLIESTNPHTASIACDPSDTCNILFSSGTTGQPKAIPWCHLTPIKVASDAYFHHNVKPGDILAWPTNLGWMMGPWLIFAAFINQGAIALYEGSIKEREFGEFISKAKVNILGVIPTLVASWRQSHCMENLNWQNIKLFSSTGECSNPEDMLYLMSLANYKPIIEYCGGTEIGGGYISSTVLDKNYPSLFSTPVMGCDFVLLDDNGHESQSGVGEVALIPPFIGLSTQLLNADHHQIYYANMPVTKGGRILRRHGDQLKHLSNGYYSVLGRVDDTMNLGGIKISAAEIERAVSGIPAITETAAIAISPDQGPSCLIIYAVTDQVLDEKEIKKIMQQHINQQLNPLFKIHQVIFVKELPKTASNKIMRRELRKR